jgi:hypothetical protein
MNLLKNIQSSSFWYWRLLWWCLFSHAALIQLFVNGCLGVGSPDPAFQIWEIQDNREALGRNQKEEGVTWNSWM